MTAARLPAPRRGTPELHGEGPPCRGRRAFPTAGSPRVASPREAAAAAEAFRARGKEQLWQRSDQAAHGPAEQRPATDPEPLRPDFPRRSRRDRDDPPLGKAAGRPRAHFGSDPKPLPRARDPLPRARHALPRARHALPRARHALPRARPSLPRARPSLPCARHSDPGRAGRLTAAMAFEPTPVTSRPGVAGSRAAQAGKRDASAESRVTSTGSRMTSTASWMTRAGPLAVHVARRAARVAQREARVGIRPERAGRRAARAASRMARLTSGATHKPPTAADDPSFEEGVAGRFAR